MDQVLAMILGATPSPPSMSPQDHYKYVQSEHKALVKEWKEYFGRLPAPTGGGQPRIVDSEPLPPKETPAATPSQQRSALGITDNDGEDWDAVDNWDDYIVEKIENGRAKAVSTAATPDTSSSAISAPSKQPTKPKLIGLRPGGRVAL